MTEDVDDEREDGHLAGVTPGAGCTEIWEHLSEQREHGAEPDDGDASGEE